jgi:hypothetical protein
LGDVPKEKAMRKIKNVSFTDLLPSFNRDFGLVRTSDVEQELWCRGDDWGMNEVEKEKLYADEDYTQLSYKIGSIINDPSGNITALNLRNGSWGKCVLLQLCAFIADGKDFDDYTSDFDVELEPDGHLIRTTVVALDAWPGEGDDDIDITRSAVGVLTYDSRLKAFVNP